MKYAVIATGGKQYKVTEGSTITIDRLPVDIETTYTFPEVLMLVDTKTRIGTPLLRDVVVTGKVLEHSKGEKIRISKFKAKAKYRRSTGFRASHTKVMIEGITSVGGAEKKDQ